MIDSNGFSIQDFYFHGRRESIDQASLRQIVDTLRTVYWYCGIRSRIGASTPYSVGKRLDPNSYVRRADGTMLFHHNKWAGYARGAHVPGPQLRGQVDHLCAGSAAELQHPLWKLLAKPGQSIEDLQACLKQLHPKTQLALQGRGAEVEKHIRSTSRTLQRLDCLEALSGLALALQRAVAFNAKSAVKAWRNELMNALLIHSYHLKKRSVAQPIFDFFDQFYAPRSSGSPERTSFMLGAFVDAADHLEHALWNIRNVSMAEADEKTRRCLAQDVVSGRYGWDLFFELQPVLK